MDLETYALLLGKVYLWDCRRNDNKPSITHFIQKSGLSHKNKISIDLLRTNGIFMRGIFCIFNVDFQYLFVAVVFAFIYIDFYMVRCLSFRPFFSIPKTFYIVLKNEKLWVIIVVLIW